MVKIEIVDERKIWKIMIDTEDVFNRVSLDSNYREHSLQGPRGDRYILLDDDVGLFQSFVNNAATKCWLKLARMGKFVKEGMKCTEDSIEFDLEASYNHDDNMIFSLGSYVDQFIDAWVLCQWFGRNGLTDHEKKCEKDAENALENIVTTVHFRRHAIKRPIDPIF